jgi:hypothetical protein
MRCAGLALRITPNGVKSWAFRFREEQLVALAAQPSGSTRPLD